MTMWLLVWVVLACVLLASLTHTAATSGSSVGLGAGMPPWVDAMADGASMLRPWLFVAPVCFMGAHYALAAADPSLVGDPYTLVASALGMLPLIGAMVTSGVGLLKVAMVLSKDEDFGDTFVPFVPTVTSAILIGVAAGAVWRLAASVSA